MPNIHPTALVHENAELAESVVVDPYVIIEEDVRIGEGTIIQSHSRIACGARIGSGCRVGHGAVVAAIPQDLKYRGEESELFIGDGTTIREFVTLNRGTSATGKTVVGNDCLIMAYSHIAHDCRIGDHVIIVNGVQMGGHVSIDDYAIIGGMTVIHQFGMVGKHCMVGGLFRVMMDVPPYVLAGQEPLSFEGLNRIGLRRRGFSKETIDTLDMLYRYLYRSGYNISRACEIIRSELPPIPEVIEVLQFIERSQRGIVRARS